MRKKLIVFCTLLCSIAPVAAQVRIDINLRVYPNLAPVPGYPVYYAPTLRANYFFYDSMYWVYQDDGWYVSSWYNGPWDFVDAEDVPAYVLRIPVRYYRRAPPYFRGWSRDAAPRWNEHWGNSWAERRRGWDQWNRNAAPARSPLPRYQREYSGNRYPALEVQRSLQRQYPAYRPRDPSVRRYDQVEHGLGLSLPHGRESVPQPQSEVPLRNPGANRPALRPEAPTNPPQQLERKPRDNGSPESNAKPRLEQHGNGKEPQQWGGKGDGNK